MPYPREKTAQRNCAVVCCLVGLDQRQWFVDRQVVIVADRATLREAPQDVALSDLDIDEGVRLDVLGQQESWLEVRLPNGITGWIQADTAADI